MFALRPLVVLTLLGAACPLQGAAPPVSETPGAMRLGSDRLRIGEGDFIVSPDGKTLASSEVGGVCLWDLPSGKVRRRFEYAKYSEGQPHAFCPESRWLAVSLNNGRSGPGHPSSVSLLDGRNGRRFSLMERDAPYHIRKASFLNRGRAVCCYVELTQDCKAPLEAAGLHVWALPSPKKLGQIRDATCFATSPKGDVLVTGHEDGSVRFYDAGTLTCIATVPAHSGPVWELAMSPDGRLLASCGKLGDSANMKANPTTGVVVWDVASRKRMREIRDFDPHNELFFTTNDALYRDGVVDEARTGRAIMPVPVGYVSFDHLAFSSDGADVAFVRRDGRVEIRRVSGKDRPTILRGTPPFVTDLAFANGGRSIVVHSQDVMLPAASKERSTLGGFVMGSWCGVWDRARGQPLHRDAGPRAKILRVAYSRDGKTLASLDAAGRLRLSRLPGGTPHPSFSPEAAGWVMDFRRTADGERICAIGNDGRAVFWDMASGKRGRSVDVIGKGFREVSARRSTPFWNSVQLSPLETHLAIDPAGRVAVVRCSDTSLEAVRLDSGRRTRLPFTPPRDFWQPSFVLSPCSRYLAATQKDGFELRDLSSDKPLMEAGGGTAFAFSRDGRYFAWGEGRGVSLFDLTKRKKAGSLLSDEGAFTAREIAFDLDAKTIAARDHSRIIYWDLETKRRYAKGGTRHPPEAPMVPLRGGFVLRGCERMATPYT